MRPQSIVRFEQAYLASVALWLLNLILGWNTRLATVEQQPAFRGNPQMIETAQLMMIGVSAVMLLIWILLWYFTARRGSEVAKWILVALLACSALGVPLTLMSATTLGGISVALTLIVFALNTYAVWMLFRPDAAAWLRGTPPAGVVEPIE